VLFADTLTNLMMLCRGYHTNARISILSVDISPSWSQGLISIDSLI